jgi:hypothetical protein
MGQVCGEYVRLAVLDVFIDDSWLACPPDDRREREWAGSQYLQHYQSLLQLRTGLVVILTGYRVDCSSLNILGIEIHAESNSILNSIVKIVAIGALSANLLAQYPQARDGIVKLYDDITHVAWEAGNLGFLGNKVLKLDLDPEDPEGVWREISRVALRPHRVDEEFRRGPK